MIRFFAGHPTIANLLMIGFLVAGLLAGPTLLRETFPRAAATEVEISVPYPGARPEDVEAGICERIESALDAVTDLDSSACESREGLARGVARMREGADYQGFVAEVTAEVEAITDFPARAEPPELRPLGLTDFVASVAVTGPDDRPALEAYAEDLRSRMLRWGGIPMVEIRGFPTLELRIELRPAALRQYGISVSDVARAVAAESLDMPAGSIDTEAGSFLIRVAEERRDPAALADIVVRASAGGGQVRLGEIARVSESYANADDAIFYNGRPAAMLDITKTRAEDSLKTIDALNLFLDAERAAAPPGVTLDITSDGATVIRERLLLVVVNGAQGLALVFAVLWLFFGLRFAFWVAAGLPVAFMGGVAIMALFGYSLNLMTTIGLLIVIGLLMDDAIVISENIARHRERGVAALDAAVAGAKQVFPNVLASFATTAMIFGSLAFLKGDLGAVLRVVPAVMLFVLTVSLVEAFLILPHHLLHSLDGKRSGWLAARVDAGVDRLTAWTGALADKVIRARYAVVGISVTILLVAVAQLAGGTLKFTAFPELDGDVIEARVLLPQGTPIGRTEEVVARLLAGLDQVNAGAPQPGGAALVQGVTVSYGVNRDSFEAGPHLATVSVDLLASSVRNLRPDPIMEAWRGAVGQVPDVLNLTYAESTIGPAGIALDMRLKGDDLGALKAAGAELTDWLAGYDGVTSVLDDLRPGKTELRVTLTEAAGPMGVTAAMVADQLRAAWFGTTVSEMQVDGRSVEVTAQFAEDAAARMRSFDDFVVTRPDGSAVPLPVVATVETGRGVARINREDGERTVTVQGSIDTRLANANAIVSDTLARFVPDLLERYPGIALDVEGQRAEATTTQMSMVKGFAIGLVGVFMLLSFQFRSYYEPVVVMLVIPFALAGTIFGHIAMGLDFSMPSLLGYVALAGVVVNNSILLVDFIKHEYAAGPGGVTGAASRAVRARFRAMFLTTTTTVAGLIPILTETSLQAQILVPLVASLVFGLIAASLVVILVLPAVFAILDDFGLTTLSEPAPDRLSASPEGA
ncbi:efflux RND transporter permease subunit [Sinisalibacter aestuarii]|uniref:Acriflavin resistance protein n=1 Tax=Sinisalibacter aestuarii TaxID=2949426 RepID=A0ABQ5LWX1_9RHOB|nr:efflux RND transporter permease subunit [Sinisalibacter aestuarii]GKY89118.1 acriflavin resistance protein [Sinisalibacter aestuarii]